MPRRSRNGRRLADLRPPSSGRQVAATHRHILGIGRGVQRSEQLAEDADLWPARAFLRQLHQIGRRRIEPLRDQPRNLEGQRRVGLQHLPRIGDHLHAHIGLGLDGRGAGGAEHHRHLADHRARVRNRRDLHPAAFDTQASLRQHIEITTFQSW
jgi:hypothetical protein